MNIQKLLLPCAILLALDGCSTPTSEPSQTTQLPQPTTKAASLRILSGLQTPGRMQSDGIEGSVVSILVVEPDGSISKADRASGSTQVWYYIRPALLRVRFAANAAAGPGPWLVTVAITTDRLPVSADNLSSHAVVPKSSVTLQPNGLNSGITQPGRVARMYVADVQSKHSTIK